MDSTLQQLLQLIYSQNAEIERLKGVINALSAGSQQESNIVQYQARDKNRETAETSGGNSVPKGG